MSNPARELAEFAARRRNTTGFRQEKLALDVAVSANRRRVQLGLSQKELARRMGVSPAYVSQLLCGKPNMTIGTMVKLADGLGLRVSVEFEEGRNPPLRLESRKVLLFDESSEAEDGNPLGQGVLGKSLTLRSFPGSGLDTAAEIDSPPGELPKDEVITA